MKYLLVGDYHIGVSTNDKFLEYQKNSIKWAQGVAREHDATLVQLGDYVDKRTSIDFKILDFIKRDLIEAKFQVPPMFLTGNHDTYFKNSSSITFTENLLDEYLLSHPHEHIKGIVSNPWMYDNILFVPWINDANRDICLKAIKETTAEYCVGHFDIIGFKMSNVHNSTSGFDVNIFNKFKAVFSGHYHLNSHQNNVHYVGSVCQLNWSDLNDTKYVYLFDSITGEFEKIENKLQMFEEIECDGTGMDMNFAEMEWKDKHLKIYLNCDRTLEVQKELDWFIDNNISVEVISQEIQLHNSEMVEEVISNNIDESIIAGMGILLDEMDLTSTDKNKIFNLFKQIQKDVI